MIGDLIATEPDQPQRFARELLGDREVRKPAGRIPITGDERFEQREW
jgi:hypothetical protein